MKVLLHSQYEGEELLRWLSVKHVIAKAYIWMQMQYTHATARSQKTYKGKAQEEPVLAFQQVDW